MSVSDNNRILRLRTGIAVCVGCLIYFVARFDPAWFRPSVDGAFLLAVLAWCTAVARPDRPRAPSLPQPYWAYALYFAALLPFCTNWRWAMTGDSVVWPTFGTLLAEHGPMYSLLSMKGVVQFSYTQLALHSLFMVLVAPSLWWHRIGQLGVGVLALAAMYNVYGRLVHPRFGLLVALCSLTTSVMIVHTFSSYPILDALPAGHAVFAAALCAHQQPASRRAWIALGLFSGLSLYLTPSAWAMTACVWAWTALRAGSARWPARELGVAVLTTFIIGLPMLMQVGRGQTTDLFSLIAGPAYTPAGLWHFLVEAATLPFWSMVETAGAFGPQLPPGFRWLFVAGIIIAPWFPRQLPAVRLLLLFFVAHVVFLAFTQGSYSSVSVKRALVLIPLATYFVFIGAHQYLNTLARVLVVAALWATFGVYDVVYRIVPGRIGYTFLDGIIEAHQRFDDAPVCVYLTHDVWRVEYGPGGPLDNLYGIAAHLHQVTSTDDPLCRTYLCYSPQVDAGIDLKALGYAEIPMLNTVELRCGRRTPST